MCPSPAARSASLPARFLTVSLAFAALALSACAAMDDVTNPDGEPTQIAVDEIRSVRCSGPFDCSLSNPSSANSNRYDDPATADHLWPIRPGTQLHDGFGGVRGTITNHAIQVNAGQRKVIAGIECVYAFSVHLDTGAAASGWIAQSAITDDIARMPTESARDPGHGDYTTVFTVSGGNVADFGDLKVIPNFTGTNGAATDYLIRSGGVFNLLFNLPGVGGVSTDTLPIGAHFHRSLGVLSVMINLYHPGSSHVARTMRFVYGHVGSRYGWIARDALTY